MPHYKKGSQSFGIAALDGWGDFGSVHNSGRDQDAVGEDDFPALEALLCPTLRKHASKATKHALHTADQRPLPRSSSCVSTAESRFKDLGNSKGKRHQFRPGTGQAASNKCAERPVVLDDDKLNSANANATSSDPNANSTSLKASVYPSPITLPSLEDDLGDANSLNGDNLPEGDNIERLYSALVDLHSAIPVCPRKPSLYRFCKPLQDQICQDDDNDHINRNGLEGPSHVNLNLSTKESERQMQHQYQEVEEE